MTRSEADIEGGVEVVVYRSARRAETYLYLPAAADFEALPEALLGHFGEGTAFLEFTLHADKVLALADAGVVLTALSEQGFYLQLPPAKEPGTVKLNSSGQN